MGLTAIIIGFEASWKTEIKLFKYWWPQQFVIVLIRTQLEDIKMGLNGDYVEDNPATSVS